ncbi:phosphotriesterase family protein [Cellulomonas rhizosphaerae]|uniref:Phosphotriesterase n=1 Tax=Cellulomonas rhizosphaerae TaxID=2293719 RepID=A0A413RLF9_9CELL|nr:phosphotriesterase [Cellulomonas rhizosphaerae]RHA40737.1 phosphotriesterase [Cellulomonas rhizosphaerae]
MSALVRTVLGDVPAGSLGVVDSHDHLFLATPALPGQELGGLAADDLRAFAAAGGTTLVQWTPRGMRRGLGLLPELAIGTGVAVVAATGRHRAVHSRDVPTEDLAERFVDDVVARRCGLIKIGVGLPFDTFERASLAAAAVAHRQTGAPVAIHLEDGRGGRAVLDELGIAPEAVVLGHVGRHPDPRSAARLAATGAFVCLDGPRPGATWAARPVLDAIVEAGHVAQILLGGDTTTRAGVGSAARMLDLVDPRTPLGRAVLVDNPARAWRIRT